MKVGFIGLGIMGKPMSKNLVKAGYELIVYDHHQSNIEELTALGAEAASGAAEVGKKSDVIITMLPNSPQVREAILGEEGVIRGAEGKKVIIDMSSIDPIESQRIGEELKKYDIRMLDAPVSGGEPKAIDGTLAVMVGGEKELFDQYYDLLMTMAESVVYVGGPGAGNTAKLANQIIVAVNIAAVSEAMVMAKKVGVSPELVFHAIKGGLAGSTVMNAKTPMMLERNFNPGFRIELHIKDLMNALNAGHSVAAPLPLTAQVMEMMQVLKNKGYAKEDHSALVKYYEQLVDITIEK